MSEPIRPPYVVAELWLCGDDECDCHQPQLVLITPNPNHYPPWVNRRTLWQGTFISRPEPDELNQLKKELRDVASLVGIQLNEHGAGIVPLERFQPADGGER